MDNSFIEAAPNKGVILTVENHSSLFHLPLCLLLPTKSATEIIIAFLWEIF